MSELEVRRVTVVGGGFSGAIFVHHLLRESRVAVAVDIVEERARLGAGVAYSASDPHQTTNIPAMRMSIYPEDRTHFARWLSARGEEGRETEHYPNRFDFGTYVDELVHDTVPGHSRSVLLHRRAAVDAVAREGNHLVLRATDQASWPADAVVLATGNPLPLPPPPLARLAEDPRIILDPWAPRAIAGVRPDDRVLVVGIGLSMGEAVAGLRGAGHRGEVTAIARRGRRPERGMIEAPPPFGEFASHRPKTAVALLRHFRAEVRAAEAAGLSWRSVQAAARPYGWDLWSSLPFDERKRFVRHLRPFWEALRHVMPGPVYDTLLTEERTGRLQVLAASLRKLEAAPDGLHATLHRRGAPPDDMMQERFDVVLNCTGPAYATLTETDPFWASLAQAELVRPDLMGLGLAVDRNGRAFDGTGIAQPDLLILGTLARGTYGELTGVPELSRQAREAAQALVRSWEAEQGFLPDAASQKRAVR